MDEKATQDARLDYLVEEFKADSVQYKDLKMPKDTEGKRRILRSLMNIRMPRKMDEAVLSVQTVTGWLSEHPGGMERVIFNVFKDEDKAYYEQLLQ